MSRLLSSTAPDALLRRVVPRWKRARYTVSWSEMGPHTNHLWKRRFFETDAVEPMDAPTVAEMIRARMTEAERQGAVASGIKVEVNR